jgi:hypothetical protein
MIFGAFYLLLLILLLISVSASIVPGVFLFSGKTDKRIRKCLLGALKRSYLDEEPQVRFPPAFRENRGTRSLALDLQQKLVFEFLDFKSGFLVSHLNSFYEDSMNYFVISRLIEFHPHFPSHDHLVNRLLFLVINRHFHSIKRTTSDPLIHDKLQLFVAKYYYEDLDFNEIPSNIYNYIICFMFEMIYGTDLKTPATKSEFLNQFVCSLRSCDYSLEGTYKYLLIKMKDLDDERMADEDFEEGEIYSQVNLLKFFHSKPSAENIKMRFQIGPLPPNDSEFARLSSPFIVAICVSLLDELLPWFIWTTYVYFSSSHEFVYYSPELVEMIFSDPNLIELVASPRHPVKSGKYHAVFLEAFRRIYGNIPDSLSEMIESVSPTNPLELDQLLALNANDVLMEELASSQFYSLSRIDAFSTMLSIDFFRLTASNLDPRSMNSFSRLFELSLKEAKVPFSEQFAVQTFYYCHRSPAFLRLFLAMMRTDDPFIFLFFPPEMLKSVKHLIQDKFDLNKWYFLKDFRLFFELHSSELGFNTRYHQRFSFKQAVNWYGNGHDPEIISIFTSKPEEFHDFYASSCLYVSKTMLVKTESSWDSTPNIFSSNKETIVAYNFYLELFFYISFICCLLIF